MLNELFLRYPALSSCRESVEKTRDAIVKCYENGGKLLLCGNGGSAADCEHIAGELMKGFRRQRPLKGEMRDKILNKDFVMGNALQTGLAAIPLTSFSSLNTATANDIDPKYVFAQSLLALGKPGDLLVAISTSGNAKNVLSAVKLAQIIGVTTVGLTGMAGGALLRECDITVCVPESLTYKVQELHQAVYHALCADVEAHFFAE